MGRARQESGPTSLSTRITPQALPATSTPRAHRSRDARRLRARRLALLLGWPRRGRGRPTAVPRRPSSAGTCEEHRTSFPCARAPSGREGRECRRRAERRVAPMRARRRAERRVAHAVLRRHHLCVERLLVGERHCQRVLSAADATVIGEPAGRGGGRERWMWHVARVVVRAWRGWWCARTCTT